jgi:hypothetical protein
MTRECFYQRLRFFPTRNGQIGSSRQDFPFSHDLNDSQSDLISLPIVTGEIPMENTPMNQKYSQPGPTVPESEVRIVRFNQARAKDRQPWGHPAERGRECV